MKWRTAIRTTKGGDRYEFENAIESDAGYTVLRCTENDIPTGRFVAFIGKTVGSGSPKVIGGYDSRQEAQEACESHLAQTRSEFQNGVTA